MSRERIEPSFSTLSDSNVGIFRSVRTDGRNIGLGPAFQHERPRFSDLSTKTSEDGIEFGSGTWSDPRGRDGSQTANEILRYLRSFQRQANRERDQFGDLIIGGYARQKTVRIGSGVRENERRLIIRAIENLNTALPYQNRLSLGQDIARILSADEISDGEIHIHITNDKEDWLEGYDDQFEDLERVLGIGGIATNPGLEIQDFVAGYALIDRNAVRRSTSINNSYPTQLEFVITHELLHAYGIGAHADPSRYPSSILVPEIPRFLRSLPPLFTSIDGEALLAIHIISPGTTIRSLTIGDLGPWEKNGYQLIGSINEPESSRPVVEFGATFRNGLSKPWAIGPRPSRWIRNNTSLSGSATWNGSLLGFTRRGQTTSGDARITLNLRSFSGQANFDQIETWGVAAHPGTQGNGQLWKNGDLSYRIAVPNNGASERFVSISDQNNDLGIVSGVFTGPLHEGATGILEHPDLSAAFGAVR